MCISIYIYGVYKRSRVYVYVRCAGEDSASRQEQWRRASRGNIVIRPHYRSRSCLHGFRVERYRMCVCLLKGNVCTEGFKDTTLRTAMRLLFFFPFCFRARARLLYKAISRERERGCGGKLPGLIYAFEITVCESYQQVYIFARKRSLNNGRLDGNRERERERTLSLPPRH